MNTTEATEVHLVNRIRVEDLLEHNDEAACTKSETQLSEIETLDEEMMN